MEDYEYTDLELKGKEIKFIYQMLLNRESDLFHTLRQVNEEDLVYDELNRLYFLCKQCRLKFEEIKKEF
jgi:hypothetical protein